jgi:hypothetical protein
VPTARRFGDDAAPTISSFEQEGIAVFDAVHRAELDEKSVSLFLKKKQNKQILKQLSVRIVPVAGAILQKRKRALDVHDYLAIRMHPF